MADPFGVPPSQLLAAAQAVPPPSNADAFILFDDAEHRFDASGRRTSRRLVIYRVLTAEGAAAGSTVGAMWSPWHQTPPSVRARVVTADGRQHLLDPTTLRETSVAAAEGLTEKLTEARSMRRAHLPALTVGSVVVEEIIIRDTRPLFAAGGQHREFLVHDQPLHRGRITLQAPTSLPLRFGLRLAPGVAPRRQLLSGDDGEMIRLTFDFHAMPKARRPPANLPYHQARFPSLIFSTGSTWQAVASTYGSAVDAAIRGTDLTPTLVGFPVAGSRQAKIDFLTRRVRETVRATGLEVGATRPVPDSPTAILQRRFGDAKDRATLLVALLRQVEIDASVALVRADFGDDVEPELPGLGGFDHALVYVPGERPMWIDPSHPFTAAGELPLNGQGRWALIAAPTTQRLQLTPTSNSVENRIVESRRVDMADYGAAEVVESRQYFGSFARRQRVLAAEKLVDPEDADTYADYMATEYPAASLDAVQAEHFGDLSRPPTVTLTVSGAQRASTDIAEAAVALTFGDLFADIPEVLRTTGEDPRHNPFIFHNPFVKEWRYQIRLPAGFVPRQLPEDSRLNIGGMLYEETYRLQDDILFADLRLDSGLRRLSPEQVEATRRGLQDLAASDVTVIHLDHVGARQLTAGQPREALRTFRHWADRRPDDAVHRVRLAKALVDLGMGEAARQVARSACERHPHSAIAHWVLGYALARDVIGRPHAPGYDRGTGQGSDPGFDSGSDSGSDSGFDHGFDYGGALQALQTAHQLDPTHALLQAELAVLLEFNAEGVRYGPGAHLDRAAETYRLWRQRFGQGRLTDNLLNVLWADQRWQDLQEHVDELPQDFADGAEWRLTALAGLGKIPETLEAARQATPDAARQAQLLNAAAGRLMAVGHFATAGELLRRTADRAEPTAARQRAELLAAVRPWRPDDLREDDPATPWKRFLAAVLRQENEVQTLRDVLHPRWLQRRRLDDAGLKRFAGSTRRALLGANGLLPAERLLDLMMSVLEIETEGDDATGYRLRIRSRLTDFPYVATVYVLPWQGAYRLLALQNDVAVIGDEVLGRLAAVPPQDARPWLDWAWEGLARRPGSLDSGDPLRGNVFTHLWHPELDADVDTMYLAAQLLLAQGPASHAAATAELRRLLAESPSPARQRILHLGLTIAALLAEDWQSSERHAGWLYAAEPTSRLAFDAWTESLEHLGREDVLTAEAQRRLNADAEDRAALSLLVDQDLRRGEFAQAFERLSAMQTLGNLGDRVDTLNTWAWSRLFAGPIDDEVLELARRSAELDGYRTRGVLHTLAMVLAELDRPLQAYQMLLRTLEARESGHPGSSDWLVVGRIAQSYGLDAVARAAYERVGPPSPSATDPTTSRHLAQRYLARLGDEPTRRKGSR